MKAPFHLHSRALLSALAICVAVSGMVSPTLLGKVRVAVKADTTAAYEELRAQRESQPQSYIFSQGKFFPGEGRDKSISPDRFREVAETLAKDLAKQGFFPTTDITGADLLIVVHWGTSFVWDDPTDSEAEVNAANADPSADGYDGYAVRFDQMVAETKSMSIEAQLRENAKLLGFDEDLRREARSLMPTDREYALRHQLDQDRYFIVLMAWDNQALQQRKERKLLWSTRFSVRSPGTNFIEALPLLSIAASDYYGKSSNGLATHTYKRHEYNVEAGEIEVVAPQPGDESLGSPPSSDNQKGE